MQKNTLIRLYAQTNMQASIAAKAVQEVLNTFTTQTSPDKLLPPEVVQLSESIQTLINLAIRHEALRCEEYLLTTKEE